MASSPAPSTTHKPPIPARTAWNASTKIENSQGARNDTARPVIVYSPKATPSLPSRDILNSRVRADDCAGPINRHSDNPHTQNAIGPDNVINVSPIVTIAVSDPTITC